MARVLLFHHVAGLTDGMRAFAADLEAGGHEVHLPDLFEGRTFGSVEEGFAHLRGLDPAEVGRRVDAVVSRLPHDLVYAGFSWGVPRAQLLAQTRPGARGAVLCESCIPVTGEDAFGPWPSGVPVQVHGAAEDEFFLEDLPAAEELVRTLGPEDAELFIYPTDGHLFCDRSLPAYDEESARLLTRRTLAFLDRLS